MACRRLWIFGKAGRSVPLLMPEVSVVPDSTPDAIDYMLSAQALGKVVVKV
jgi:hypothetical protein